MRFLQWVVQNEAMKLDPPEIYGWRIFLIAITACLGGTIFGMDTGTMGGVLVIPAFKRAFRIENLNPIAAANLSANIVSALQAGCFIGAMMGWPTADRLGRKPALLIAPVLAALGVIIQAASAGHIEAIYAGRSVCLIPSNSCSDEIHRVVAGLGVGMASVSVPLMISEHAPRAIRGALTGLYQLSITSGIMLAFWVDYGSLLHISGEAVWIVPIAMQAVPAVLLFVGMSMCYETPRHLARKGDKPRARATLAMVRNLPEDHPYIVREFGVICDQIDRERILTGGDTFFNLQKELWTVPSNRRRAYISIILMICQQMTGTNAINYYGPTIFRNLGLNGLQIGLFATGIYGCVKVAACACFLLFAADSLGRRRSLLWTALLQCVLMLYIGLYIRFSAPMHGHAVPPAGYLALICVYLFAGVYQWGWGPVPWIYIAEIPTVRLRSTNVAIGACTQWLFNFVIARASPRMLATLGRNGYGTFLVFGCLSFLMFIFTWFFIPETKGMFLEDMDEIFGLVELSARMLHEAELENGPRSVGGKMLRDVSWASTMTTDMSEIRPVFQP
ncbi:general substrate transporter [Tothia fuscella]|uniref:General substrate transporter n=1 Tax=Tothia fuscella TaxID=1048955 RepID=A0A9P4P2L4_9PEZI|nr:general substrate transporter [Tothia fuscella]